MKGLWKSAGYAVNFFPGVCVIALSLQTIVFSKNINAIFRIQYLTIVLMVDFQSEINPQFRIVVELLVVLRGNTGYIKFLHELWF